MNSMQRSTLSLATFVLICFFLPWVQLSCAGLKDSVSGYDLAREGDQVLWFIPLFMLAILMLGLLRFMWAKLPAIFALAGTVGGSLSAYLMYRERSMTNGSSKIVATQWTAVFWLGFVASLGITTTAFIFYLRRSKSKSLPD